MNNKKNLIVCGPIGSGKTSIAKIVCEEFGYNFISMYKVMREIKENNINTNKLIQSEISKWLNEFDNDNNYVIDCDCFIMPDDFNELNISDKYNIIFLGFYSLDKEDIFNIMSNGYKRKNIEFDTDELKKKIDEIKTVSLKLHDESIKYGYNFFDLNIDKEIYINEVVKFLKENKFI